MVPVFFHTLMRKHGFSLVELTVVIAIIGLLTVTGFTLYQNNQRQARDARRKTDLHLIQRALELYKSDNGQYPGEDVCDSSTGSSSNAPPCIGVGGTWCPCSGTDWDPNSAFYLALVPKYLSSLPKDPLNNSLHYYYYEPVQAGAAGSHCEPRTWGVGPSPSPSLTCPNNYCGYQIGVWLESGSKTGLGPPPPSYTGTPYLVCDNTEIELK